MFLTRLNFKAEIYFVQGRGGHSILNVQVDNVKSLAYR